MITLIFWDIENVSIYNLDRIMDHILLIQGNNERYVVYSKIKEARKQALVDKEWILINIAYSSPSTGSCFLYIAVINIEI